VNARQEPLVPTIAPTSVATKLFVRAYAEPRQQRRYRMRQEQKAAVRSQPRRSMFDRPIFVFDTETVEHRLTFGAFEEWRGRKLVARAVFYADTLPTEDPETFARLREICEMLGVRLVSLESIFQQYIWPWRNRGGTICCFNAPYDLSRICDGWHSATKTDRAGSRYCNGVALTHAFSIYDEATGSVREVAPVFARIKRDDRHHVRYDIKNGRVLDLATLAFALTNCSESLAKTCRAFGVPFEQRPGRHSGAVTPENVAGCLYDVQKTSELLWALAKEYERHPIALRPDQAQSGASIAKAYLDAFSVLPRLKVQPDFDKSYLGFAAQCYFGGRVECRIVHTPVPCVYLDFASMYPTVFSLLNLWFDHVIPAELVPVPIAPAEAQALLEAIGNDPSLLIDKAMWPKLAFFAQVEPNDAFLPARVEVPTPYAKSLRNITIGPVESVRPLWYAGPDLAAAVITAQERPRIVRAWKLRASGSQPTLTAQHFRGDVRIDPAKDDFFRILIEQRKRTTDNPLDDQLRDTGFKNVANSGAYGDFAETNPADIDPDSEPIPRPVEVYANRKFTTHVDRPESPGRFCFFPTASLVTAAARLLLALGFCEVARAGGEVAYADTDSLVVVATRQGGLVPCEGGPYRLGHNRRAVRALSWKQVDAIRGRLESLNPYRTDVGPLLKLEGENLAADKRTQMDLWFYGVSEKAYALFTRDEHGEPVIQKYSSHTLGQYQSPITGDRDRTWIEDAWRDKIRAAFGRPTTELAWEQQPALAQLNLTTWFVIKAYLDNPNIRPFDFLLVATPTHSLIDFAEGYAACCSDPRPSCFLFDDPAGWHEQDWRCLRCGEPFPSLRFRSYGSVLRGTLDSFEVKRLCANGHEPGEQTMRGLTIPRPVRVESITPMGKEVIVDPTDTDEGLTAEMLSETRTVDYLDPDEPLDALRARVRDAGVKTVAREMGKEPRELRRFVNQMTKPEAATVAKIEAALERLHGPSYGH
jgi:hypothetical protein